MVQVNQTIGATDRNPHLQSVMIAPVFRKERSP